MRRELKWVLMLAMLGSFMTGCGQSRTVEVAEGEELVYLKITGAEASSFDKTPDWAPEPDPMAPADGDMMTRWSSDYEAGEQWIYFDLGQESVVSNIIIRWERAYATEYKILVSDDARSWQEVYHEKNGQGGAMEADLTPVKCRYIKILGMEKVDDNWGISIWEIELYGPENHNPHASVTKNAYLGKSDEEAKEEELKKLLEGMASPVTPLDEKPFQHGVVYTSWVTDEFELAASGFALVEIKKMGFDTVAIMVPGYQDEIDSKVVFTNDKPGGDTPTIEALENAIKTCHKLGMRVMIKPHVDPRTNEARINIIPSEEWFDSYEEFILRYAKLSKENDVEMFSIGTELEGTTFSAWTHRWNGLIDRIKGVYDGVLTYSANWTEYKEVPFWDRMDFIGIDAYFPLTDADEPSVEDLVGAWNAKADEIQAWLGEKGLTEKGVLFTEIGYTSTDGTNRQPWVAASSVQDEKEQADCFEALFRVFSKRPWFKGYYIWQYFPQKRWSPLGFTITDKEAENVVRKWLKEF